MRDVRARLAKGTAWMTIARVGVNALGAISTVVLANLLDPGQVGVVLIATTMLNILAAITTLPLSSALVQHREPTRAHFDTAWTLSAGRSALLGLGFALAAWPAGLFYADRRLPAIMLALAGGTAVAGLQNPRSIMKTRELVFWQQFVLLIVGKTVAVAVTLTVALGWRSYWALVLGGVAGQIVTVAASYTILPYLPRPRLAHWRELGSFSAWVTLSQLVGTLNWRGDQLLVGWRLGAADLGAYVVGNGLAFLPTREATAPLTATLFPSLARLQDEPGRLATAYRSAQSAIVALTIPAGLGMAAVADPLVRLAMGPKWLPTIPIIQALAAAFAVQTIGALAPPLAMAAGRTRLLFVRELQGLVVRLPVIAAALFLFGFPGLIAARVVTELALIGFSLNVVRQVVGVGYREQVGDNLRSLLAGAAMAAAVVAAERALGPQAGVWRQAAALAGFVALGALVYAAAHAALWIAAGRPDGPEREAARAWGYLRTRLGRTRTARRLA